VTRRCGMPDCDVIIVVTRGTDDTNRCLEHQGQRAPAESDDERMERVCREMGWRRAKERR